MLYKEFKVRDKTYKCVLNARGSVEAERKLGENPLNFLLDIAAGNKMPSVEKLLIILWASLQKYEHGISIDDVYDIYDDFIAEGNQIADLIPVIMDIFEVSGYFKKSEEVEDEKNAEAAKA